MVWTLERINREVRTVTGIYKDDIQDDRLNEIIQDFWQVSLPSLVKADAFKQQYRLLVRRGQTEYPFPNTFLSLNPVATCEGANVSFSYDQSVLDLFIYNWYEETFDGGIANQKYHTLPLKHPAEVSSICVFSQQQTYFWGDKNLNYSPNNKVISVTLDEPLGTLDWLKVKYRSTNEAPPEWVVIAPSKIIVYPIPNREYVIHIAGIRKPDPLPYTGVISQIQPAFLDLIVYGSALKIFSILDRNGYDKLYPIYQHYESQAMAVTHQNLMFTPVTGL